MKTEKAEFKIGDSLWFMIDNKVVEFFVWTVKREEALTHKSEYGYAHDHKVIVTYDYHLRNHKENDYKSESFWLSEAIKNGMSYFKTKKELIESL